jgi:SsrA-binding protein
VKPTDKAPPIAVNRKARFDYFIEERLRGRHLPARLGGQEHARRQGADRRGLRVPEERRGVLFGAHINALNSASTHVDTDPTRTRKLLLNRRELDHLVGAVERRGYTLCRSNCIGRKGRAKLQIGLAKGKKQHDKRATEKDRDWQRDKGRIMKANRR